MKWFRKQFAIYPPRGHVWAICTLPANGIDMIVRRASEWTEGDPSQLLIAFLRAPAETATNVPNKFAAHVGQELFDYAEGLLSRVLFDLSDVETWSLYAIRIFLGANLHAFEVVPDTFDILRWKLPPPPAFNLNRFELLDEKDTLGVYIDSLAQISGKIALYKDAGSYPHLHCELRCGADYAAMHGIDATNALKIDVEGAEDKIQLIDFESNRSLIVDDFLLKHANDFIIPRGYCQKKVMPKASAFHCKRGTVESVCRAAR